MLFEMHLYSYNAITTDYLSPKYVSYWLEYGVRLHPAQKQWACRHMKRTGIRFTLSKSPFDMLSGLVKSFRKRSLGCALKGSPDGGGGAALTPTGV